MLDYNQLSEKERWEFYILYKQKVTISQIARVLGRHRSTLYRELKRNQSQNGYFPTEADKSAKARHAKPQQSKIYRYATLRTYVYQRLKEGWSPEQISGRLRRKKSKYAICHETIYRYIYQHQNKGLYRYLRYRQRKRICFAQRHKQECRFGMKRLITQRPEYVKLRQHWGHWEGDLVEFHNTKSKVITTLVERKSRLVLLIKNETKKSEQVMEKIKEAMQKLPSQLRKSITFDQGGEFSFHSDLESKLRCPVYYCHTNSPWEKGSNENTNGRLRKYLPRIIDIDRVTQEDLNKISDIMNATPRKCLGYRTPKELFLLKYNSCCRTSS